MSGRRPALATGAAFAPRARARLRYAAGLRRFFRDRPGPEQCAAAAAHHARREQAFLDIVERGIHGYSGSPYRRLLAAAGIDAVAAQGADPDRLAVAEPVAVAARDRIDPAAAHRAARASIASASASAAGGCTSR